MPVLQEKQGTRTLPFPHHPCNGKSNGSPSEGKNLVCQGSEQTRRRSDYSFLFSSSQNLVWKGWPRKLLPLDTLRPSGWCNERLCGRAVLMCVAAERVRPDRPCLWQSGMDGSENPRILM